MSLMEWNQKFSVNVKEIDEQHKKWIGILNELHDSMRAGKGSATVGKVLDELVDYTKVHFTTEERLMQANAYPHFAGHKRIHENMVREVEQLREKYRSGSSVLTIEVMQFLKNWLSEHITGTDQSYSPYLNSKGIH